MVASPEAYRWSSHAGNTGLAEDKLLTPHIEYEALASMAEARHSVYRGLFNSPNDAELVKALRDATFGGYALLGDQLKSRLIAVGERVEREKPGSEA